MWIILNAGTNSGDFYAYGLASPFASDFNDDKSISRTKGNFNIDPYDMPDLSDITFNTKSFYSRKAHIGDLVEFYMLFKPFTNYIEH